jgi:hypothetical protein
MDTIVIYADKTLMASGIFFTFGPLETRLELVQGVSVCAGNTVGGNLEVHNNMSSLPIRTLDNNVLCDLFVHKNTGPVHVLGNIVTRELRCLGNSSITGGPNPGSRSLGQCF